jgi:hypothetical protein
MELENEKNSNTEAKNNHNYNEQSKAYHIFHQTPILTNFSLLHTV